MRGDKLTEQARYAKRVICMTVSGGQLFSPVGVVRIGCAVVSADHLLFWYVVGGAVCGLSGPLLPTPDDRPSDAHRSKVTHVTHIAVSTGSLRSPASCSELTACPGTNVAGAAMDLCDRPHALAG